MVKRVYFFKPIFIREEGYVFIDYENTNEDNKITFKRYAIKGDIKTDKVLQKEIDKLESFFKQNKISLIQKPYLKTMTIHGKSKNINEVNVIFFFFVKNTSQTKNTDNSNQWIQTGDFIVDEDIVWWDKSVVSDYLNGRLANLIDW